MNGRRAGKAVVVPRSVVDNEGGVVILPIREYRRLLQNTVPAVYLTGRKARALDRLVETGLQEEFDGDTREIGSLADLDE